MGAASRLDVCRRPTPIRRTYRERAKLVGTRLSRFRLSRSGSRPKLHGGPRAGAAGAAAGCSLQSVVRTRPVAACRFTARSACHMLDCPPRGGVFSSARSSVTLAPCELPMRVRRTLTPAGSTPLSTSELP
jgi:hypothetical protein